jgi:hypothetical protein
MSLNGNHKRMKIKLLTIVVFLAFHTIGNAQDLFTVSPTLHINFGNGDRVHCSYGFEVAYWHLDDFYHSVDCGLEFQHKKIRLYGEVQTGVWFTGISLGPVIEFSRLGDGTHGGFQGSIWTSNVVGIDYRRRWINGRSDHAFGLMLNKYPIPLPEIDLGKYQADTNSQNNGTVEHHHSDWDWD